MLQTQPAGPIKIPCGRLFNSEAYKDQSKTHWGLNSAALWLSRRKNINWGCKGVCKPRVDMGPSRVTLPDALLPSVNAEFAAKHRSVASRGSLFIHKPVNLSPWCSYAASPNLPQPQGDDSHSFASEFWPIESICQFCICCCHVAQA